MPEALPRLDLALPADSLPAHIVRTAPIACWQRSAGLGTKKVANHVSILGLQRVKKPNKGNVRIAKNENVVMDTGPHEAILINKFKQPLKKGVLIQTCLASRRW